MAAPRTSGRCAATNSSSERSRTAAPFSGRDLSLELFGARLAMPLGIGPTGLAGLFWPDGECAAARAAHAAGTFYCASHGSACTLENIAATGSSPRWMQVFVYTDRGFTREMVERAAAAK